METRNTRSEVPTWIPGLIGAFGIATIVYVFASGGNPFIPALIMFGVIGMGFCMILLYDFYRFVMAVNSTAEKY